MKTIKLTGITPVQTGYAVALGNGYTQTFSNKKAARKFLADTDRFLNLKLHEINLLLADLQRAFRRNWFYFDHNKRRPKASLFQTERSCLRALRDVDESMDLAIQRSSWENGNQFVFSHFEAMCRNLDHVIRQLQQLQKSKSNAVDVYELQVCYIRLQAVKKDLRTWNGSAMEFQAEVEHLFSRTRMRAVK